VPLFVNGFTFLMLDNCATIPAAMPQESFESWVGRMADPVRELCAAFWYAFPERWVRITACGSFCLAALGGAAAMYETTLGYPDTNYPTEQTRAAEATTKDRVALEMAIAEYSTLAGLTVTGLSAAVATRRSNKKGPGGPTWSR
jgi:hypothetical protein